MTTKEEYRASIGRPFGVVRTRTQSGLCLHRDNKTGALSMRANTAKGFRWDNMIPNAFPLPAGPSSMGGTCDGATEACLTCYALHGLEFRTAFADIVAENLRILNEAHEQGRLVEVLLEAVDLSAGAAERFGIEPTFRWHSDGDIFAAWYARAIRKVAQLRPDVTMWIYTRSYVPGASFLGALVGPRRPANLHVFLSVDEFNVGHAARQLRRFANQGVRAAILAESPEQRAELESLLGVASIVCPATGRYNTDGKGSNFVVGLDGRRSDLRSIEVVQGACNACKFCFKDDERSVTFNLHGGLKSRASAEKILYLRVAELGDRLPRKAS